MKRILTILILALAFTSCKKENSIQTFFVEHQELPNYSVIDISSTLIDFSETDLSAEEKKAYESLDKLHVLLYNIDSTNTKAFDTELKAINKVFKNKDYTEMMQFSDNGIKFKINTIGNEDTVDEVLVLASMTDKGFATIRVIGDAMEPEKIVGLFNKVKETNVDESKLNGIMNFFK